MSVYTCLRLVFIFSIYWDYNSFSISDSKKASTETSFHAEFRKNSSLLLLWESRLCFFRFERVVSIMMLRIYLSVNIIILFVSSDSFVRSARCFVSYKLLSFIFLCVIFSTNSFRSVRWISSLCSKLLRTIALMCTISMWWKFSLITLLFSSRVSRLDSLLCWIFQWLTLTHCTRRFSTDSWRSSVYTLQKTRKALILNACDHKVFVCLIWIADTRDSDVYIFECVRCMMR